MKKTNTRHTALHWFHQAFRPCQNESGIAVVETAATMGLFLLAMFSVVEFGWFYAHQTTMTAAVRDGIRMGALGNTVDDGMGGQQSREDSVKQAIRDRAEPVMDIDPNQIQIFPINTTDWSDGMPGGGAGGAGCYMRVRVTYNHEFFNHMIGSFFSSGMVPIVSSGSYRNENFILPGGGGGGGCP